MTIAGDIHKLSPPPPADKRLGSPAVPPSIVAQRGLSPVARPTGNGNIASPLTETAYTDREFHAAQTTTSTDGVFTVAWKPIRVTKFLDANGNPVVIQYAEPT